MKTYETYKDSGIEWIGQIPTEWNVARLRYRGKSIIGITYKPDEVSDETNGTLVLRSSNVQNGKLDFKDCVYVDKKIQENQLVKEGDILVCARNGSAHLVGKCAYIPKELENVSFGAFMSIVRTDLDKFLFYYFNSQVFKGQKGLFATSTINQLTSNMLNNLDIPIPQTKEEQRAIANYLDKKTAEIDQLISEKEELVQLYQEEKTAIINQAVTKGINPDVKLKDSGIEWLGDIPGHWEVKRMKYVVTLNDESLSEKTDDDTIIEYIEIGSLKNGVIDSTEYLFKNAPSRARRIVRTGDVIVSTVRTYLKAIAQITEDKNGYIASTGFAVLRPVNINSKYLGYYSHSESFIDNTISNSVGVTYPAINASEILEFPIQFPPTTKEQTEIVKHIEKESTRIDAKIAKAEQYINLLTEYRTALISEVVTGKIKVID